MIKMTLSDNMSLVETENSIPRSNSPGNMPLWAAALPLWASAHWLWLAISSLDRISYWTGSSGQMLTAGQTESLEQAPLTTQFQLIVLDCRAVEKLPGEWWQQLEQLLTPGGLLLVCCRRNQRLPAKIRSSAPKLSPAEWHVIEPGQEGNGCLRPAIPTMRRITLELDPPYSTRVWLARMLHRWLPQRDAVDCLPVWRTEACA
jgi:hypothetical protein